MSQNEPSDFLKANAAALRALAGGVDRQVRYAGQDTHIGKTEIRLPALRVKLGRKAIDSRGAATQLDCGWPITMIKPPILLPVSSGGKGYL